jgi:hypothetical protein
MMDRKIGRNCLSLVLLLVLVFQFNTLASGISNSEARLGQGVEDPPAERIVSPHAGLDKLSPDLRELIQEQPQVRTNLTLQAANPPLIVSAMIQPGADIQRFFLRSAVSREVAGFNGLPEKLNPNACQN